VKRAAEQLRDQQTTGELLSALQQRHDQFDALAAAVEKLAACAALLSKHGVGLPPFPSIAEARQTATELRERYESDVRSARAAQPRTLEGPITTSSTVLAKRWAEFAAPPSAAVALVELLGTFPPSLQGSRLRISTLCDALNAAARKPPASEEEVLSVEALQAELQKQIDDLRETGLDAEVQAFLRDSATGVPLRELLEKPSIMQFLRANPALLDALSVGFRAARLQGRR
jgi:hypothetical protein